MGGGESSAAPPQFGGSGQPYDLLGGQYASFSGGTPGFDWGGFGAGVGQGLNTFGKSISAGSQSSPSFGSSPSLEPLQLVPSQGQTQLIPQGSGASESEQILKILQSILGSGMFG